MAQHCQKAGPDQVWGSRRRCGSLSAGQGRCPTRQPTFLPSTVPAGLLLGFKFPFPCPSHPPCQPVLPLSVHWLQPFLSKRLGWSCDLTYPDGPEPFANSPGLTAPSVQFKMGPSMNSKLCHFSGVARNRLSAWSWGGGETLICNRTEFIWVTTPGSSLPRRAALSGWEPVPCGGGDIQS